MHGRVKPPLVLGPPCNYGTPRKGITKIRQWSALTLQKCWKIHLESLLRFLLVNIIVNLDKNGKIIISHKPEASQENKVSFEVVRIRATAFTEGIIREMSSSLKKLPFPTAYIFDVIFKVCWSHLSCNPGWEGLTHLSQELSGVRATTFTWGLSPKRSSYSYLYVLSVWILRRTLQNLNIEYF